MICQSWGGFFLGQDTQHIIENDFVGGGRGRKRRGLGKILVSNESELLTLIKDGSESLGVLPSLALEVRDSFMRFSSLVMW